jgi:hypothetical protein
MILMTAPLPWMLVAPVPIELKATTLAKMLSPIPRLKGDPWNVLIGIVHEVDCGD